MYLLYDALDLQCQQCALRMKRSDTTQAKMTIHMDWHFRMNRRIKERLKRPVSRDWFISKSDWITERERVDVQETSMSLKLLLQIADW